MFRRLLLTPLLALVFGAPARAADPPVSFNRDVRPILSDKCYYCHGTDASHRKAGLRLDTAEGATDPDHGPAVVPGKPDQSELWRRIVSDDPREVMPPPKAHKALTAAQRTVIRRWIEQGAKYEPHWAFVAPKRPAVPAGAAAIDHFVDARLKAAGIAPAGPAEPAAQLRRATLDLTGLPPTAAELDAFETAARKDLDAAYAAAVDRLLASPRYGERMALDWLDAARYADTNGYQMDAVRMNWPWRDWVVRAFNANMRFDQFTTEQLAGDLLPNPTTDQLVATAFNRNHMLNAEGGTIPEENRTKNVFDRVEAVGTVWLGLTLNCCQCHDHKFDPLTQKDYYGLFALFNRLSEPGGVDVRFVKKPYSDTYDNLYMVESPYILVGTAEEKAAVAAAATKTAAARKALDAAAAEYREPFARWVREMRADPALIPARVKQEATRRHVTTAPLDNLTNGNTQKLLREFLATDPEWQKLAAAADAARAAEDALRATVPHVMVMRDDRPRETRVLKRGNYETPGEVAAAGVPAFLPKLPAGAVADRLVLARWLLAPDHPLTARVAVNRLWQLFFGRGLVTTPDDFGLQGALPTHPELLDWLAVEFRESGWDVKHMVRLIVTSRAYRRAAAAPPAARAADPHNELLARGPRHRLDSRFLRDQALALSGLLVEKRGGPPVMPYQPDGIWEEMSFGKNRYFRSNGDDLYRRSLYTFWRRTVAPASFFDVSARQVCEVRPLRTNTPLHALATLNDPTYVEAARVWAERLAADHPGDDARLGAAFRAATGRRPGEREMNALRRLLETARGHFARAPGEAAMLVAVGEAKRGTALPAAEHAAWTTVCLTILNSDEALSK